MRLCSRHVVDVVIHVFIIVKVDKVIVVLCELCVILTIEIYWRRLVLGFKSKARRPVLATLDAGNVLATHGAAGHLLGMRALQTGVGGTNRRVLGNFGSDTGSGSDCRCDFVAHNAGRGGLLGEGAGSAREQQLVLGLVFAGEQQVGAGSSAMDMTSAKVAHHSEQKRNRICLFASWPLLSYSAAAGDDMLRCGLGVYFWVCGYARARCSESVWCDRRRLSLWHCGW